MPKQQCTCGAKYRFDDSAVGRKARCKKCGRVFTITPDTTDGTIPLAADDPLGVDLAAAGEQHQALKGEASYRVSPDPASPPPSLETAPSSSPPLVDELKPSRRYLDSLLWTLLFPTSLHNLLTFCVFWGLLCVGNLILPFAGILGLLGRLIILGWYCAFRFETITIAAAGEDDLPSLSFSEGVLDDIILPLVRWIGSWTIVFLPALVCLFILISSGLVTAGDLAEELLGGISGMTQGANPELVTFVQLVYFAQFLWPMVALCVGLGGFQTLSRFDLMVVTIVKTFPVYLLTVAMVFVAGLVSGVLNGVAGSSLSVSILVIGVGLYCEIVAMRFIGLYYHHFKHRFAWDWG